MASAGSAPLRVEIGQSKNTLKAHAQGPWIPDEAPTLPVKCNGPHVPSIPYLSTLPGCSPVTNPTLSATGDTHAAASIAY